MNNSYDDHYNLFNINKNQNSQQNKVAQGFRFLLILIVLELGSLLVLGIGFRNLELVDYDIGYLFQLKNLLVSGLCSLFVLVYALYYRVEISESLKANVGTVKKFIVKLAVYFPIYFGLTLLIRYVIVQPEHYSELFFANISTNLFTTILSIIAISFAYEIIFRIGIQRNLLSGAGKYEALFLMFFIIIFIRFAYNIFFQIATKTPVTIDMFLLTEYAANQVAFVFFLGYVYIRERTIIYGVTITILFSLISLVIDHI